MVIRITVSDNDFTEYLERFGAILAEGYLNGVYSEDEYEQNPKLFRMVHREETAFIEAIRVAHSEASSQQLATVKKTVEKYFSIWFEKIVDAETAKYLKKSFDVEVYGSVSDRWENGEAVYIIPTAYRGKIITM